MEFISRLYARVFGRWSLCCTLRTSPTKLITLIRGRSPSKPCRNISNARPLFPSFLIPYAAYHAMAYPNFAGPSSSQFSQQTYSSQPYPSQPAGLGYTPALYPPEVSAQPSASMSEILLDPLARLQNISTTLFQSLGPPQSRPPPPPSVADMLTVDAQLAGAVHIARAHQVKQRRIEQLKDEVLDLDRRWRDIVRTLDEGRRELDAMVREGEERIKAIEEAKAGASCCDFALRVWTIERSPSSPNGTQCPFVAIGHTAVQNESTSGNTLRVHESQTDGRVWHAWPPFALAVAGKPTRALSPPRPTARSSELEDKRPIPRLARPRAAPHCLLPQSVSAKAAPSERI